MLHYLILPTNHECKERDHLEYQEVDGSVKLGHKESGLVDLYFIYLCQNRNKWRTIVKKAMNFLVP